MEGVSRIAAEALLREVEELSRPDDPDWLMRFDERIHRFTWEASGNPYLAETLERYFTHSLRIWYLVLDRLPGLGHAVHDQGHLLEALLARTAPAPARSCASTCSTSSARSSPPSAGVRAVARGCSSTASGATPRAAPPSRPPAPPPASRSARWPRATARTRAARSPPPTPRSPPGRRGPDSSARSCSTAWPTSASAAATSWRALLTLDQGKPLKAEAEGEVGELIEFWRMAAEDGKRLEGRIPESAAPGRRVLLLRRPLGVVGLITPWNWPYTMPAEVLAPALACGNCVVWTPAPSTAVCSGLLAECVAEADLPPGVFNMVLGPGPEVGDELAANPGTRAVAFTGSTATGLTVARRAAGKAQLLEMGGNGPFVVMEDADLEAAAEAARVGAFLGAGQSCSAAERLLVHEARARRLRRAARRRGGARGAARAIRSTTPPRWAR